LGLTNWVTLQADLDQHRENELHLTDENEERDPRNRVNRGTENRQNGQNHNNNGGCQANQPLLNVSTSLGAIWQGQFSSTVTFVQVLTDSSGY
jgi:hypothetical protein